MRRRPRIPPNAATAFATLIIGVHLVLGCKKVTRGQASAPPNRPAPATVPATLPAQPRFASIPTGRFEYTGYHQGIPVVTGTLEIWSNQYGGYRTLSDPPGIVVPLPRVCGAWLLASSVSPPPVTLGPQVGSGDLDLVEGSNHEAVLLTSRIADCEVSMVVGQADRDSFSGIWQYADVSGVVSSGRFVARRTK